MSTVPSPFTQTYNVPLAKLSEHHRLLEATPNSRVTIANEEINHLAPILNLTSPAKRYTITHVTKLNDHSSIKVVHQKCGEERSEEKKTEGKTLIDRIADLEQYQKEREERELRGLKIHQGYETAKALCDHYHRVHKHLMSPADLALLNNSKYPSVGHIIWASEPATMTKLTMWNIEVPIRNAVDAAGLALRRALSQDVVDDILECSKILRNYTIDWNPAYHRPVTVGEANKWVEKEFCAQPARVQRMQRILPTIENSYGDGPRFPATASLF